MSSINNVNVVRGGGPLDTLIARLRHGIAYRKLKPYCPLECCLDIGSGAYPAFLSRLSARQKYGIEQSVTVESSRAAAALGIHLVQCNVSESISIPFQDNFFDAVTMLAVIEHIHPRQVQVLLSEVRRILKPEGIFVLTTPAAWTDRLLRIMAAGRLISREEIEDHKDTFTRYKLKGELSKAGFHSIRTGTFECGMNLWAVAAK
jgi:SAM-dependent methyltransferase